MQMACLLALQVRSYTDFFAETDLCPCASTRLPSVKTSPSPTRPSTAHLAAEEEIVNVLLRCFPEVVASLNEAINAEDNICAPTAEPHNLIRIKEQHCCSMAADDGSWCRYQVLPNRRACAEHACKCPTCDRTADGFCSKSCCYVCTRCQCSRRKLPAPQVFCKAHACFQCVLLGHVSPLANDVPPRNVCDQHALCYKCHEFAIPGMDVCEKHNVKLCQYQSWWGRPCCNAAIYGHVYCTEHMQSFSYYYDGLVASRAEESDGSKLTPSASKGADCSIVSYLGEPQPRSRPCS